MNLPLVSDVIGIINKIAPFRFAEEWDNSGLQVGDSTAQAGRMVVALDACPQSLEYAIAQGCSLLVTHHPLLFKPMKRLSRQDPVGSVVCHAIEAGITIVAMHTNYDVAEGGVNDLLADRLGISVTGPLRVTASEELVKLAVFVPEGHEEKVLAALSPFSRGIGNYSDCSFRVTGTGTYKPLEGAAPFIGEQGKLSSVMESRVELMLHKDGIDAALAAMKKVHPYEEPAFDIYQLVNRGKAYGMGRIGDLPEPATLVAFVDLVKRRLDIPALRYVGDAGRKIRRVAVCGGSGVSLLNDARFKGADVLVTGDVKYHEAREAEAYGIAVVDAGHFATERLMVSGLADSLEREFVRRGFTAELLRYGGERDPFIHG